MANRQTCGDPLVLYVSFPFGLKTPLYGRGQPYVANSAARHAYTRALANELDSVAGELADRPVEAVRLGGGASYANADQVMGLVRDINRKLSIAHGAQVSIAADPLTVGTPTLTDWSSCGVRRVELRAVSVHDDELEKLGVSHTRADVENALAFLSRFHIPEVDVLLFYGLAGQTVSSWRLTLRSVADMGVTNVTAYPFATDVVEPGLPSREERAEMGAAAEEVLGECGYEMYAVGRFVRSDAPHARDRFDEAVRAGAGQVGLGAGALSRYDGFLYRNTLDFDRYVQKSADFEAIVEDPRRESVADAQMRSVLATLDALGAYEPDDAEPLDAEVEAWLSSLVGSGLAERVDGTRLTAAGRLARAEELSAQLAL